MRAGQVTEVAVRAAGAATVIAVLAACGASGEGHAPAPAGKTSSGAASNSAPDSDSAPTSSSVQASSEDNQHLLKAGETARGAVADSTVTSLDSEHDDTVWEVHVVAADGTEHEMKVSGDGATVTEGPTAKSDSADEKTDNRSLVETAKIDYREAVTKVTAAVPGRVTELELDTKDGTTVWEADVRDSADAKHKVVIDAGSGEVVSKN